jgi:2'-5' RNA ligase
VARHPPASARPATAGQHAARQAARSGCYQSPQPFHPHITLLREARHAVPIPPPGFSWTFAVSEFVLYESRFSRGRTRYTALERYPFNKES